MVARVSDALRERPGARSGDFQEMGIRGNLIKDWQEVFRLGQKAVVHVHLELPERVVHSQAVILGLTLQQNKVLLLPGQPFEDLLQLRGR